MLDDAYYEKVATFLASLKVGETFSIREKVRKENQQKFLDCFKAFAGITKNGPYWWDWNDEKMTITKFKRFW